MPSIVSAGTTSGTSLNLSGDTSGVLALQTNNGTTAVTIDTSQRVGIGTASPTSTLHVNATSGSVVSAIQTASTSGGNTASLQIRANTYNYGIYVPDNANVMAFYDYGQSLERMRIDSSGNVGIGTSTINARLHVTEENKIFDTYGNINVFSSTASTADAGGAIALGGRNGQGTDPYVFGKIKGAKESGGTWNGYLAFGTTASTSALLERMRIDSIGNVGLTTANVNSNFGKGVGYAGNTSATASGYLDPYNGTTGNTMLYNTGAFNIVFGTSNTERMRINSSGDVFINSTSGNGACKFNVNGNTFQNAVYTGNFTGGWQNVLNIDSTFGGACGRIRVQANENGNNNVSYGEWFFITSAAGPQLSAQGQVTSGNAFGTAQLRMSGSTLQIQNALGGAIGSWKMSFEIFVN